MNSHRPSPLSELGKTDTFIFRPKRHFGLWKSLLIILGFVGIGLAMYYALPWDETIQQETSLPGETDFDWRPIPGERYPS
ncbi:hypothetical protein [Pontibacter sp. G13]|uniref:hypothetical protein n=1 Tax=Pontibacter sp. G13 TaxID=3074898 RepID=UPI00288A2C58|nr:hypothetical protein [Pontibacter sp. G13]WNJ19410.1 hypothetical protein RJD25_02865 [Pontibacter sp. G13]